MTKGDDTLYFAYDAAGTPMAFTHKVGNTETTYYYATNLQGDIIAILDDNGNPVVQYTYDAWGNPMGTLPATGIGALNPLRYRGYVYDTETALYYLQSRYYNPQIGRFLNADGLVATGQGILGNNMFAYCGNNPVVRADWTGRAFSNIACRSLRGAKDFYYATKNYAENSVIDKSSDTTTKNKLINDQNGDTGKLFTYGNYSASWNACEPIAIHNAKTLTGQESTLSSTMLQCQLAGAMIGDGYFGSNPYSIGNVLNMNGIAYTRIGLKDMTNPGTYIISYWHDPITNGAHTVAVTYDGSVYTTYNLRGNGKISTMDPNDYAQNFICGYYLG